MSRLRISAWNFWPEFWAGSLEGLESEKPPKGLTFRGPSFAFKQRNCRELYFAGITSNLPDASS